MGARFLPLLVALQAGWPLAAQAADPLHSSSCSQAMAALRTEEDRDLAARPAAHEASGVAARPASAAKGHEPSARVQALRRDAARACLGGPDDPLIPHRYVAPPAPPTPPSTRGAPSTAERAPGPGLGSRPAVSVTPVPPTVPAAPPVRQPALPPVITACDAAGCWSSDGAWMQRAGPNLQGPRGLCVVQNGMVMCP
jgi:hypothetical protein